MKKNIKRGFSLLLTFILTFFVSVESNALNDSALNQMQCESVALNESSSTIEPKVTGLIYSYNFSANKDGTKLLIYAKLTCATSVVKCGLKEMVIQRRVSTDYAWSDYLTYEDIYQEDNSFLLSNNYAVTTGYQYRVVATLYAKKSLFSTEKVEVTSNIVWI